MGVLAWCWDFDWTSPVEVEVAQSEGQLLYVHFGELRLVLGDVKVGWQNATLSSCGWRHIEVEGLSLVSIRLD